MTLCPELRRLEAEHAGFLAKAERGAAEGEEELAARLLALFADEILPHCRREEDVLLPELCRRLPEADAIVVFTLGDHVALRRLARELREACGAERPRLAEQLLRRLQEHVEFEKRTLFPAVQEQLGSGRLAALAAELRGRCGPVDGPPAKPKRQNHRKGTKP